MEKYNSLTTSVKSRLDLKNNVKRDIHPIYFKSVIKIFRYLTYIILDKPYKVRLINRYMKTLN
jgi:hypothetical protein